MKKPKIAPFDSMHPIWTEMFEWFKRHSTQKGVFSSTYSGKAYCASCEWKGTYEEFEKAKFTCPVCGAPITNRNYGVARKERGTLIIDEKDGIVIFRFIGFSFFINEDGPNYTAEEMYRIYTDKVDYEIFKLTDGKTLRKYMKPTMEYQHCFKDVDVYEHHNYDAHVYDNDFIKQLDILDENTVLEDIFSEIAKKAAKNSVMKICPKFAKPMPTPDFLLKTNFDGFTIIESHVEKNVYGQVATYDAWCGKCGKFHTKNLPVSQNSAIGGSVSFDCDCGIGRIYVGNNRLVDFTRGRPNTYIDVQFEKDCTVLRYTNFTVSSTAVADVFLHGKDCGVKHSATIKQVYYVCCFSDGTVTIYNEQYEPLTQLDIQNVEIVDDVANDDIASILENDKFVCDTGFVDFGKNHGNFSLGYFFGYMQTENAKELVACNLQSLIFDFIRPSATSIPAYLAKNNGKFSASMFSQEQIDDFALHFVQLDYFVGFMQIFKKDPTVIYGDYCVLCDASGKNFVSEVYRRIPDVRFDDVYNYISYLNSEEALAPVDSVPLWCNYLNIAKNLHLDMSKKDVVFPKSLKMSIDILARNSRESGITIENANVYAETAKKVNISCEDERWSVKVVKDMHEFDKYRTALMNSQNVFAKDKPDRFTLIVSDLQRNCIKYLIDIEGTFVNDELVSGRLVQFYAFGNTFIHGRYQYDRILKTITPLAKIFQQYNI